MSSFYLVRVRIMDVLHAHLTLSLLRMDLYK
jgi:hypothetical protein